MDYAIVFCSAPTDSGWNGAALYDVFLQGLVSSVKGHLLAWDLPDNLDELINNELENTLHTS